MINCPQTDPHGAHSYLRLGGDAHCPGVPLHPAGSPPFPSPPTDAELDALSRIVAALEGLDRDGQDRIAGYLFDRYRLPAEPESTEGDTT